MKIQVTVEHIKNGCMCDESGCPVWLAIKEALPRKIVLVGENAILVGNKYYDIPVEVNERIMRFDTTGEMEPFQFDLPIGETPCPQ